MENPEVCFTVHIVSVDSLIMSCILRSYLVLNQIFSPRIMIQ
jgi:hypothetical protein